MPTVPILVPYLDGHRESWRKILAFTRNLQCPSGSEIERPNLNHASYLIKIA